MSVFCKLGLKQLSISYNLDLEVLFLALWSSWKRLGHYILCERMIESSQRSGQLGREIARFSVRREVPRAEGRSLLSTAHAGQTTPSAISGCFFIAQRTP